MAVLLQEFFFLPTLVQCNSWRRLAILVKGLPQCEEVEQWCSSAAHTILRLRLAARIKSRTTSIFEVTSTDTSLKGKGTSELKGNFAKNFFFEKINEQPLELFYFLLMYVYLCEFKMIFDLNICMIVRIIYKTTALVQNNSFFIFFFHFKKVTLYGKTRSVRMDI